MKKLTFLIILLYLSIFGNSYAELTAGKFINNPDVDVFVNKMVLVKIIFMVFLIKQCIQVLLQSI